MFNVLICFISFYYLLIIECFFAKMFIVLQHALFVAAAHFLRRSFLVLLQFPTRLPLKILVINDNELFKYSVL